MLFDSRLNSQTLLDLAVVDAKEDKGKKEIIRAAIYAVTDIEENNDWVHIYIDNKRMNEKERDRNKMYRTKEAKKLLTQAGGFSYNNSTRYQAVAREQTS